ncbi:MAG: hypothetical protein KF802_14730 [Bdellovibrionaceae bacterium]|nr:hypothetical protein [Pseudobdellovibrionaceae bacterium]
MKIEHSLGYVWASRKRIKRVFFFTYQFNFYWFHNNVLPYINRAGTSDCEVLVVASKFDQKDLPSFGDQYELSAWCGFERRFRLFFLESSTVFHGKFVVCEYEGRKDLLVGIGSANLTKSGWLRNLETWNWNARTAEPAIKDFLLYLSKGHLKESFLSSWTKRLKSSKTKLVYWLDGSQKKKADTRLLIWKECAKQVGMIKTVRITSPYFDDGSKALLQEILIHTQPDQVEVVLDLSGALAGRKHLERALALRDITRVKFLSFVRSDLEPNHKLKEWFPLHAKTIEFLDSSGRGCTVYGSANFTAAAWMRGNHEFVGIVKAIPQPPEAVRLEEVKVSRLEKLIKATPALEDDDTLPAQPMIFWATYDETHGTLELRHSEKATHVNDVKWDVEHDKRRDEIHTKQSRLEVAKLKKIEADFLDPKAWRKPAFTDQHIRWERTNDRIDTVPEHLAIIVTLRDGHIMKAPVIQSFPNFEERDPETGFPTETALDLDSLLGRGRPIVRPIKGRVVVDPDVEDEEDDETNNEESFSIPSLSTEAEYNHLPEAVKFTKALSQIQSKEDIARIQKRLRSLIRHGQPSNELLLARALLEVLE